MTVFTLADYRPAQVTKLKSPLGLMLLIAPTGIGGGDMATLVADLQIVLTKHDHLFAANLAEVPHTRNAIAIGKVVLPGRHFATDLATSRSIRMDAKLGVRITIRWLLGMDADAIAALISEVRAVLRNHAARGTVNA